MPVNIIDTLKPKNGGSFPIVEAIDVFVENYGNLAEAVSHFATDVMIEAINTVLSGKANTSDVNTAVANLQGQIDQIVISASAEAVVAPEVAAARVDSDGIAHATLKARIDSLAEKTEIDISSIINGTDFKRNKNLGLEQGVIQSTGAKASQSYTVRTAEKIHIVTGDTLVYDNSVYKVNILGYDNSTDEASAVQTGYVSVSPINLVNQIQKSYINLDIRRIDEADITPSDIVSEVVIPADIPNAIAYADDVRDAVVEAEAYFDVESQNFLKKTVGKNKFNKNAPAVDGKYIDYTNGQEHTNADFHYSVFSCDPSTNYACNKGYIQIAFYSAYPEQLQNFISGAYGTTAFTFETPASAKYMIVSYSTSMRDSLQIEYGTESTSYEAYTTGLDGDELQDGSIDAKKLSFDIGATVYNEIVVDINGNGDYTSLREALESIDDSSEKNQYIVKIKEGTYDIKADYTAEEWAVESASFIGLRVPDFTTLVGVGDKENVILTAKDTTQREYISTLNLQNTSSLKNLTVKAENLRYTIHDDFAQPSQEKYTRTLDNCDFYGTTLQRVYVYGCGIKEGADYKITNCRFFTDVTSNFSFVMHNNVNWGKSSNVAIENCRFGPSTSYGILLASMGTNTKLTYVTLKGNKMKRLRLNENSAQVYGPGITFKVSGYANAITDPVEIINTDGVDYSSYVDLI